MHDPYKVEPRRRMSDKAKLQMLVEQKGLCCLCGLPIGHKPWDAYDLDDLKTLGVIDEHKDPLWRNGTNDKENRGAAHDHCAQAKTDKESTDRAKGRRVSEKHFGAARKGGFRKPPKGVKFDWKAGRYRRDGT